MFSKIKDNTVWGGKLIIAVIKWMISALYVWLAKFAAILISPIASLFIEVDEEGYTQFKWRWVGTHDTHAHTWWTNEKDRTKFLLKGRTQEDFDNKAWLRWACRVFWIFRNPAYVVAQSVGYDQRGMQLHKVKDEGEKWDTGEGNFSYWWAINHKKQVGWMVEFQWFYWGKRCLEVYCGWKLHRDDPDQLCMLVARITPFKQYG